MPRIKMFMSNKYMNYEDEEYETAVSGVTEWGDVTEKEFTALWKWAHHKNNDSYNEFIVIVSEVDAAAVKQSALEDYKKMMEKDKKAEDKRKAATAKRKATLAKKKAEKKRAEYEKLKEEFENA